LGDLIQDGSPTYAWPADDRSVWALASVPLLVRILRSVTGAR
jgi:hypothetical protein